MRIEPMFFRRLLGVVALSLGLCGAAMAQDFKSRPITIVVPFAPGSATDSLARLVAGKLAARWGQTVLVDNRAGAGGNMGAESVYRAEPDGSTLLFMPGPFVQKTLYPKVGYDPEKLVMLSDVAKGYSILVVSPRLAVKTVPELIAYAKANPGKLNYASQGIASVAHLTGEMFRRMADIDIVHVPYKGNAPAVNDLLGGQVQMMFLNLGSALPYLRSDKLRAIGIGSETRSALLPDVPTIGETVPGFVSMVWFAMFAPPGTPAPVAAEMSAAVAQAVKTPEVSDWLKANTFEAVGGTPSEAAQALRVDNERWLGVIKANGITGE